MNIRLMPHRTTTWIERKKAMVHLKRIHDSGDSLTQYPPCLWLRNVRSCKETVQEKDQSNAYSNRLLMKRIPESV